jgi:hypothetical protein
MFVCAGLGEHVETTQQMMIFFIAALQLYVLSRIFLNCFNVKKLRNEGGSE